MLWMGGCCCSTLAQQRQRQRMCSSRSVPFPSHPASPAASPQHQQIRPEEQRGIPHHLIDVLDPEAEFSAGDFFTLARAAAGDILRVRSLCAAGAISCSICCLGFMTDEVQVLQNAPAAEVGLDVGSFVFVTSVPIRVRSLGFAGFGFGFAALALALGLSLSLWPLTLSFWLRLALSLLLWRHSHFHYQFAALSLSLSLSLRRHSHFHVHFGLTT